MPKEINSLSHLGTGDLLGAYKQLHDLKKIEPKVIDNRGVKDLVDQYLKEVLSDEQKLILLLNSNR